MHATARTPRLDLPASAATARAIDLAAESHRHDLDRVRDLVAKLDAEITAVKTTYLGQIRQATARARASRQRLADAVVADPSALGGLKTIVLHEIRCGWRKDKDKLQIPNPSGTCLAIKALLPAMVSSLIKVTEAPVALAIGRLDEEVLAKIGAHWQRGTDRLLVEPVDGDIDRLVNALIGDLPDTDAAAAGVEEAGG
jgi:hypothetical protein